MRLIAFFVVAVMSLLTYNVLAADKQSSNYGTLEWDGVVLPGYCDKDMYTSMVCMGELRDKTYKDLEKLIKRKTKSIKDSSKKKRIIEEHKAWLRSHQGDCASEVGEMPAIMTSGWNFELSKCLYKRTVKRIDQLKVMADGNSL